MFISLLRARCTDQFMQPPVGPPVPSRCDLDHAGGDTLRLGIPTYADSRSGTPRLHPLASITIEDPRRPKMQIQPIAHAYAMDRQGPRPAREKCRPDPTETFSHHMPLLCEYRCVRPDQIRIAAGARPQTLRHTQITPRSRAPGTHSRSRPIHPAGRPTEGGTRRHQRPRHHTLRHLVPRYTPRRSTAPGVPRTRSRGHATPTGADRDGPGPLAVGPSISVPLTPLGESSAGVDPFPQLTGVQ